jgi:hypothetical protein
MSKRKKSSSQKPQPPHPGHVLSGCSFTGVHWDKASLETITTVAKGLLNLTELFKAQNIKIEPLVSLNK